jgi:hypothetical protein
MTRHRDEIEETLITADVGPATRQIVERLRGGRVQGAGTAGSEMLPPAR